MSSTASNYDVSRLFIGTSLACLSFVLTFFTLPNLRPITSTGIFYAVTLLLYGVLMLASSYVEEEHNFWYWATSGWFFYLFISSYAYPLQLHPHPTNAKIDPEKSGSQSSSSTPPSCS